jgi:hypothetical protein
MIVVVVGEKRKVKLDAEIIEDAHETRCRSAATNLRRSVTNGASIS